MTTEELQKITEDRTKVLLFGVHPTISELIVFVINYLQKDIDYFIDAQESDNGNEFFLYQSIDSTIATFLPPTVAFLGSSHVISDYTSILNQITPGGILVYPEFNTDLDLSVLQTTNFFRKIAFNKAEIIKNSNKLSLRSDMGEIPLSINDESAAQDLLGAQHLCQHIGIMEDEFYEALIAF